MEMIQRVSLLCANSLASDTEAEKEAYYRDSNWPDQDEDPLAK